MLKRFRDKKVDGDWLHTNFPCMMACPAHTNAGRYVGLIAEGRFEEAYRLARDPNPLASICGRVCAHPCETACRRGEIDKPISIRALKRFLTEQYGPESKHPINVNEGRGQKKLPFRVAVVGHLRPEKDPLRTAEAARRLPETSKIQVLHIGVDRCRGVQAGNVAVGRSPELYRRTTARDIPRRLDREQGLAHQKEVHCNGT